MTLFSRCDSQPDSGRHGSRGGRRGLRRDRPHRAQGVADFMEDIGILLRYATGRDYYDHRCFEPKD